MALYDPYKTTPVSRNLATLPMFERLDGLAIVETHFNKEVDQASYYIEKLVKDRLLTQQHLTGNIIDVCCGYGGASFVLAKDSANVTAVDNNPNCMAKSRVNARIGGCNASAENGNQAIAASLVSEQLIALEERTIEFSRSRFLAARAASSLISRALSISSSFPFNLSSGVM